MVSKTVGVCAGVAGALFVGYCCYFDYQRRKHPDYRTMIRNKRRQKHSDSMVWPDLNDPRAVQRFFLDEIHEGEELLTSGQIAKGTDHLARAVAVCGTPQQLLSVMQQTLPTEAFVLLVRKLPGVSRTMVAEASKNAPSRMAEDAVE